MLVEAIVLGVLSMLTAILAALPDLSLPAGGYVDDFAAAIGGALGGLDGFLPITEVSTFAGWVLGVYLPVVVAYNVSRWVYTHLPVIGNGG